METKLYVVSKDRGIATILFPATPTQAAEMARQYNGKVCTREQVAPMVRSERPLSPAEEYWKWATS